MHVQFTQSRLVFDYREENLYLSLLSICAPKKSKTALLSLWHLDQENAENAIKQGVIMQPHLYAPNAKILLVESVHKIIR